MRRGLFGLLLCVLLAVPAWAQETRGAIEGAVRDASGGVLPGVSVEAAGAAGLLSADHFTVDGTLLEVYAVLKSSQPKAVPPPSDDDRGPRWSISAANGVRMRHITRRPTPTAASFGKPTGSRPDWRTTARC